MVKCRDHWELQFNDTSLASWSLDFNQPALQQRVQRASIKNEAIAKAIGIKSAQALKVLDCTAGIGRDGYLLAHLGCDVTMLERSPVMAILLDDALKRSGLPNLKLIYQDAIAYLCSHPEKIYDVIYLDPMFPEKKKAALVKKEMQILQQLVGRDLDSDKLFQEALKSAKKRVVVKRPKNAESLCDEKPHHVISSKKYRFDVYSIG